MREAGDGQTSEAAKAAATPKKVAALLGKVELQARSRFPLPACTPRASAHTARAHAHLCAHMPPSHAQIAQPSWVLPLPLEPRHVVLLFRSRKKRHAARAGTWKGRPPPPQGPAPPALPAATTTAPAAATAAARARAHPTATLATRAPTPTVAAEPTAPAAARATATATAATAPAPTPTAPVASTAAGRAREGHENCIDQPERHDHGLTALENKGEVDCSAESEKNDDEAGARDVTASSSRTCVEGKPVQDVEPRCGGNTASCFSRR